MVRKVYVEEADKTLLLWAKTVPVIFFEWKSEALDLDGWSNWVAMITQAARINQAGVNSEVNGGSWVREVSWINRDGVC